MTHYGRALVPALLGSLALVSLAYAGTTAKVTICHFPPGNPANFQTITFSTSALAAHLAHGDVPGPCANDCKLFGCADGNACTTNTCSADGTCSHSDISCGDSNPCTSNSCNFQTGCVDTPLTDGTSCSDDNTCTGRDSCQSGQCQEQPIAGRSSGDRASRGGGSYARRGMVTSTRLVYTASITQLGG
jgi:hypothetical protein